MDCVKGVLKIFVEVEKSESFLVEVLLPWLLNCKNVIPLRFYLVLLICACYSWFEFVSFLFLFGYLL